MTSQAFKSLTKLRRRIISVRGVALFFAAWAILFFTSANGSQVSAQQPTVSPSPVPVDSAVPVIAPDFQLTQKPLPELSRVGVDADRQKPLSLREALALALANNKDIEVARENVRISDFDL